MQKYKVVNTVTVSFNNIRLWDKLLKCLSKKIPRLWFQYWQAVSDFLFMLHELYA